MSFDRVRTGRHECGKPVYQVTDRFQIVWHRPLPRTGFGVQGWRVIDLQDPYENPDSEQYDPLYDTSPTLKLATAYAQHLARAAAEKAGQA